LLTFPDLESIKFFPQNTLKEEIERIHDKVVAKIGSKTLRQHAVPMSLFSVETRQRLTSGKILYSLPPYSHRTLSSTLAAIVNPRRTIHSGERGNHPGRAHALQHLTGSSHSCA
jgi:hypothetical protein